MIYSYPDRDRSRSSLSVIASGVQLMHDELYHSYTTSCSTRTVPVVQLVTVIFKRDGRREESRLLFPVIFAINGLVFSFFSEVG
ncbi:hypothetical protein HMPREF2533_02533 [Bacteroides fragilis]|nr:hypothetical protein HMPREF2530_02533 [Bacteroides fragilis]KXU45005.1 hypothetical protein HMPREF2533_02533 [Bacteroides fragilis]QCT78164.1 hypothetical protein E0L14_12475 [Bacteroides fragilis]RHI98442.1 hypothetical protein DW148_04265 [Bacteroides fragilis]